MVRQKEKLSIVAIAKDEKENIKKAVTNLENTVKTKHELLIVCSTKEDNTIPEVKKLKKEHKNIKLQISKYGAGVINQTLAGIESAKGGIVVLFSTDGTDDPKAIDKMFAKINSDYDIVCATRFSKGGKMNKPFTAKAILARVAGLTTKLTIGIPITDLTYSFKMFPKKILDSIKIESKGGFEFAEELVIKSYFKGYKITEVPALWTDRVGGESKFKLLNWLPRYIYWYFYGIMLRLGKVINR